MIMNLHQGLRTEREVAYKGGWHTVMTILLNMHDDDDDDNDVDGDDNDNDDDDDNGRWW